MIPVFAAETISAGDFKPFDIRKFRQALPQVEHARRSSASNMISKLRYTLSTLPFIKLYFALSLLWRIVFRASLPPETTAFLNSIATTVENVSYHLFFSPHLFIYKQVRESNEILRLTGVHLEHRGEDKEELNELVERAMQAMQTHAGVLTTTGIYLIPLSFTLSFTSFTLFLSFSLSLFLSFPLTHLFFPFEFSLVLQGRIVARTCKNCKLILLKMEILFFLFFFSHFI